MSEGAPSQRLPRYVDPRKLASAKASINGTLLPAELPALSQAVDCIGEIEVSLAFSVDEDGEWVVKGQVQVDLVFECQRCLTLMEAQRMLAQVALGIVWTQEEATQLPNELDLWVVPGEAADLYQCVEEELLLNLPVVTYHDYTCIDTALMSSGDKEGHPETEKETANPFSILSALKRQTGRDQ